MRLAEGIKQRILAQNAVLARRALIQRQARLDRIAQRQIFAVVKRIELRHHRRRLPPFCLRRFQPGRERQPFAVQRLHFVQPRLCLLQLCCIIHKTPPLIMAGL